MPTSSISVKRKTSIAQIVPVMLCFFAMGFVDLVGTASNYVQKDLSLTDSQANLFPSLVFFWFLIFSVPTGLLMNKIGRKRTVLVSLVVTLLSLIIPIFGDGFTAMLIAFSLLGIGNSNIFSIVFAQALNSTETEKNEVSGLMIMGLFGGTVFPLAMGYASDAVAAQWGAIAVMTIGVIYLLIYNFKIKN